MTKLESNKEQDKFLVKKDQAQTLRIEQLKSWQNKKLQIRRSSVPSLTRVISFTSGKGGAGKTHTIINTAICLSQLGKTVLVLDADLGLANVNVLLGIQPKYTLQDVFSGKKSLRDILIPGPQGISIIPAASGVESICDLNSEQKLMLLQGIEDVAYGYDYLLIDTRAGISSDVMYFNTASSEIICIINNEPTSLTDAYATIKVLSSQYKEKSISVVVNKVKDQDEANKTFLRLAKVVNKFLPIELKFIGFIQADQIVVQAIQSQKPVVELFPTSAVTKSFNQLAKKIDEDFINYRVKGGMQFFFEQILSAG